MCCISMNLYKIVDTSRIWIKCIVYVFVQILGTPTLEEIKCMNPNYTEFNFPHIKSHPWHKVSIILTHALSLT